MTRPLVTLIGAVLALIGAAPARAQLVRADGLSPFAKDYKVDFAVPDAPALKLLASNESSILRPQSVRDLSLAVANFRGTEGAFVIPKSFAVELSPGLAIGSSKLRVTDYQAARFLHALRISGATGHDSLNRGQLAAGIRLSLVDEQDLARSGAAGTDTTVTRFTRSMLDVYRVVRKRVGPTEPLVLNDDEQAAVTALGDSIKQHWADHYWNARSVEIAFAGRVGTADTLGRDPKVDEIAAWVTYADGLRGWGQLLLGVKLGSARDTTGSFRASNTVALRLYIGANDLKAFVEGQRAVSSGTEAKWLANSGIELRLPGVGWVNASAGYATGPSEGRPRLISSFKLKTAWP